MNCSKYPCKKVHAELLCMHSLRATRDELRHEQTPAATAVWLPRDDHHGVVHTAPATVLPQGAVSGCEDCSCSVFKQADPQ